MNEPETLNPASLAYENKEFLNSPDGRALRIMAEYFEPLARFRKEKIQDTVVFFGSARFASQSDANSALAVLERTASANTADLEQQLNRCRPAVDLDHYYRGARQLCIGSS